MSCICGQARQSCCKFDSSRTLNQLTVLLHLNNFSQNPFCWNSNRLIHLRVVISRHKVNNIKQHAHSNGETEYDSGNIKTDEEKCTWFGLRAKACHERTIGKLKGTATVS